MFDRIMYKILGSLDFLFDIIIPNLYERLKKIRIFSSRKRKAK